MGGFPLSRWRGKPPEVWELEGAPGTRCPGSWEVGCNPVGAIEALRHRSIAEEEVPAVLSNRLEPGHLEKWNQYVN